MLLICILRFIKVTERKEACGGCEKHQRRNCLACSHYSEFGFCFVQWHKIIDKKVHLANAIDAILGCVLLKWQRGPGEDEHFTSNKKYGLTPVESICEVVHVVRSDTLAPTKLLSSYGALKEG